MFNNNRYIKYVFLGYFDYRHSHDFKFLKHSFRPLYSYVYGQLGGGTKLDFKRNGGHKLIFSKYYLHLLYSLMWKLQTMFQDKKNVTLCNQKECQCLLPPKNSILSCLKRLVTLCYSKIFQTKGVWKMSYSS